MMTSKELAARIAQAQALPISLGEDGQLDAESRAEVERLLEGTGLSPVVVNGRLTLVSEDGHGVGTVEPDDT